MLTRKRKIDRELLARFEKEGFMYAGETDTPPMYKLLNTIFGEEGINLKRIPPKSKSSV